MSLVVYTDGSSINNPGRAGWGFCLVDEETKNVQSMNRGYFQSTNNRMEFMALIYALFFLRKYGILNRGDTITIYTDSELLINTYTKWIDGWHKKNFKDRKNVDLLKRLFVYKQHYNVILHKVPAHSGVEYNEHVDDLARWGANLADKYLWHDINYELGKTSSVDADHS